MPASPSSRSPASSIPALAAYLAGINKTGWPRFGELDDRPVALAGIEDRKTPEELARVAVDGPNGVYYPWKTIDDTASAHVKNGTMYV